MARLLDPTGRLFGERVISQQDSTSRKTKDLDVVLGAESAVLIIDDTEAVRLAAFVLIVDDATAAHKEVGSGFVDVQRRYGSRDESWSNMCPECRSSINQATLPGVT
jgi:TFIIF-interacting CTD phosphatase-like protein